MIWSRQTADAVVAILKRHGQMGPALDEIQALIGMTITRQGVDHHLRKLGYMAPGQYLCGPRVNLHDTQPGMPAINPEDFAPVVDPSEPPDEIPVEFELDDPFPPATDSSQQIPADRTHVDRGPEPEPYQEHRAEVSNEPEAHLYVPDCHHPFADRKAWALLLKAGHLMRRRFGKLRIFVLGDFADMWVVSAHDKDPRRGSQLEPELVITNEALDELDAIGADDKHYIEGNHETRLARYLSKQAPALLDTVRIDEKLRVRERGWTWTPYRSFLRVGSLAVTHDLDFVGVNALTRTASAAGQSIVIGHTHRMGLHYSSSVLGDVHVTASFGWLGDPDRVDYRHRMKVLREWQTGFGVGLMEPSGAVHLHPVPIVGGRAAVMGELL